MNLQKTANIAILIVVGFCLGGMFSDVSTIEHSLSEWQTLIAGNLAVVAAAWTIGEMRRNDTMQQQRHAELVLLSLRADRLRARRAAFPYADRLEQYSNAVYELIERLGTLGDVNFNRLAAHNIAKAMRVIVADVNADAVVDAKPLFGSAMAFGYASLEKQVNATALPTIGLCEALAEAESDFGGKLDEHWPQIARNSLRIASSCRDFAAELRTLAKHYGPD